MFEYVMDEMEIPTRMLPRGVNETEEVTIGGSNGDVYIQTVSRTDDGGVILKGITLMTSEEHLNEFEVEDMVNFITYECWKSIGEEVWMGKRYR